jgi:hypothetical protein
MKFILFATVIVALLNTSCGHSLEDLLNRHSEKKKSQDVICAARYVPVGNDPEIALDTQTGSLCRTISDTNDPLGILDSACGVTEQERKVGFVPDGCKSGRTWVKGEGDKNPSRYTALPRCSEAIVAH